MNTIASGNNIMAIFNKGSESIYKYLYCKIIINFVLVTALHSQQIQRTITNT